MVMFSRVFKVRYLLITFFYKCSDYSASHMRYIRVRFLCISILGVFLLEIGYLIIHNLLNFFSVRGIFYIF